jgi:predicted nucleotidyltransferase
MTELFSRRHLSDVVPKHAEAHLRAFRREVVRALPENVVEVVLFGSRARGEGRSDSDYDVAVFVRALDRRRTIDHTLADRAYKHLLAGIPIRAIALPADFLDTGGRGSLSLDIARDGVAVP